MTIPDPGVQRSQSSLLRFAERFPVIVSVELAAVIVTVWWWTGGDVERLTMDDRAWQGETWRVMSSALPHVNIVHLVFNLSCLAIFGSRVEATFGSLVTAFWLLVFAAGSMVADYDLADAGVGLSGVGYALFGFLWVLSKRDFRFYDAITPQTTQFLVGWFFLCIALTYTGVMPVANVAHGAGAGLGALAGLVMSPPEGYRRSAAAAALMACLLVIFGAGAYARPYVNLTGAAGRELAQRAVDALKRDDDLTAVALLQQAVRSRGALGGWWHNLGVACFRVDRLGEAAAAFRRAAEMDPEFADDRRTAEWLESPAPKKR